MTDEPNLQAEKVALKTLNDQIAQKENDGDRDWLASILAPRLTFMRANGKTFDDGLAFLQKVEENSTVNSKNTRQSEVALNDIDVYGKRAIVRCIVTVTDKDEKVTEYENLRLFVKQGNDWKLLGWANEPSS